VTHPSLTIADMTVAPGQRGASILRVALDDRWVKVPVIANNGASEAKKSDAIGGAYSSTRIPWA
jgi:hypothetical protein